MFDASSLNAIQVRLASPEKILEWSHGEVTRPETINYRSQKPEDDGLFCEKIFGPTKDYECKCGKYKRHRYDGVICEKCGVEVTTKSVRRERMGHIDLACPVAHIWYFKGTPSRIASVLAIPPKDLEEVIIYTSHICINAGTSKFLNVRDVLDERTARNRFISIFQEIAENLTNERGEDDPEVIYALEQAKELENPQTVFDFASCEEFINKHTGAEFGMGAEAILKLLREIDIEKEFNDIQEELASLKGSKNQKRQQLIKRLDVIDAFRESGNKPEWMILTRVPVISPELRPMLPLDGGRFACSDLNELYRRVVYRNNRLKRTLSQIAPDAMIINEKRLVQEAVDSLIDNGRRSKPVSGPGNRPYKSLSNILKGKQGRFRQNLLGKRVDYSGRSVIAVGPDLKMYQCGIPREMAVQLFKPFIASQLLKDKVVLGHRQAEGLIAKYDERIWPILDEIIKDHPVLLNRAPTLHRLGIQAFEPKLVDGRAIRLHPLVCPSFNADFDGDQMAVHVPLSHEAIEEARTLMIASRNILGPKDGKPVCIPSQEMVLGNYYLTTEEDVNDFLNKAKEAHEYENFEKEERYKIYAESEGKVFGSIDDIMLAYETKQIHLHNRIAIRASAVGNKTFTEEQNKQLLITTPGKIIFNSIFPNDLPYLCDPTKDESKNIINFVKTPDYVFVPFGTNVKEYIKSLKLNVPFKKKDLGLVIDEVFRRFGTDRTSEMLDDLKDQGFHYATISGLTVSLDDIVVLKDKEKIYETAESKIAQLREFYELGMITDAERHKQVIDIWNNVKEDIQKRLVSLFESDIHNPIYMMKDSGARGNDSNFLQLAGMRGLMSKPGGDTIEVPIKSSFREGLTVAEFFISTHGTRKGGADTALKTSSSGYLTRRLVDVAQDVVVRDEDCHTDHGTVVRAITEKPRNAAEKPMLIEAFIDRLIGRNALRDVINPKTGEVIVEANKLISEPIAKEIVAAGITEVEIRTLFGCQAHGGVCKKCYGKNLATGAEVQIGDVVGVMAAQSIGEPGTQLTMRTFHTGGVAGNSDITQGLPRVEELFEARNPKGQCTIAPIAGEIIEISEEKEGKKEIIISNDIETKSVTLPYGSIVCVAKGDHIMNGDKLTEGTISPKELLEVCDVETVQNYILKEVQKVYRPVQGIEISDKHIEVIVRQMFTKLLVTDGGDTTLIPGTKVGIEKFTKANEIVLIEGKRPAVAHPLILGITKAALETDSFLSAASFQETTRILTDAACRGRTDYLHGLKENVIVGKLIPAGTGLREKMEDEEIY